MWLECLERRERLEERLAPESSGRAGAGAGPPIFEGQVRFQSEDGEHLKVRRAVMSLRTAMCRPRAAGKKGSYEES